MVSRLQQVMAKVDIKRFTTNHNKKVVSQSELGQD